MKQKLKNLLDIMHEYNTSDLAYHTFGVTNETIFDALVIAPGWKPTKIITDPTFHTKVLAENNYDSSYLVEKEGLKILWIQCSSSAANLMDHLMICSELHFKKLIFVGAVGSLNKQFNIGDICTPSYCISGVFANAYLCEKLCDYKPFEKVYPKQDYINEIVSLAKQNGYTLKQGSVYCTDSIALEYAHLEEIKSFHPDLIEMETSTFYLLADLLEVDAIALLVVSDNSALKQPLIGRNEEMQTKYNYGRKGIIPDLIYKIAKGKN
ncbi:MAG: hypothetical protein K2K48_05860 [Anaeroplasmataceae bacterium]|nr:hypothetical protein [Anaeroplasmataceae bacterium]MDE6414921.1 hypothetical protein [Anaeroplasmataceae bacterium]